MGQKKTRQIKKLQNQIFIAMLALIVVMTVILSILSIEVNIFNEKNVFRVLAVCLTIFRC